MGCAGCFSNTRQEREALRIIQAKAKQYAQSEKEDMVIYRVEGEIKFDRKSNRQEYEQIVLYIAEKEST